MTIPELLFTNDSSILEPHKALLHIRATTSWLYHFQSGIQMRSTDTGTAAVAAYPISLPKAVHGALLASVPETRRDLCGSVLLTGGGANMHNLHERLKWELMAIIPAAFKPKVVAPSPVEREFAPWIGGSVLCESGVQVSLLALLHCDLAFFHLSAISSVFSHAASLGTFQQMWVSKLEYEERGAASLDDKCP
jgi:uncharacterized membrane protein